MGKLNLKKHVWHKYAISAGILGSITAIALGSMYAYAQKSDDKHGKINPTKANDLITSFIDVRNEEPKTNFVEIHNNKKQIEYNPKADTVKFADNTIMSTDEYLNKYYQKHHALPYLNIKYGSFNFYNQYIEAVSPLEFFNFTKWFMSNVSWGPEILTLKSFSIVKGVEMHGNSITLGSHANKNKEYTTIKFFPDAFFGTLPMFSELDGRGNMQDSLTYKINKNILTAPELQDFLANIAKYNSFANISADTINKNYFRNINNVSTLKGQKVYAIRKKINSLYSSSAISEVEKNRLIHKSPYLTVIAANDEKTAREILKTKLENLKKVVSKSADFSDIDPNTVLLEEKTIINSLVKANDANNTDKLVDKILTLVFDDGSQYFIHQSFNEILTKNETNGHFEQLKNYLQIDKAIEKFKNDYEEIHDKFIEAIKKISKKDNWTGVELGNLVTQALNTKDKSDDVLYFTSQIGALDTQLADYTRAIEALDKAQKDLEKNNAEIDVMKADLQKLKDERQSSTDINKQAELDTRIKDLTNRINDAELLLAPLRNTISGINDLISTKAIIESKNNIIANRTASIKTYQDRIAKLESEISTLDSVEDVQKINFNNKEIRKFQKFIKHQTLLNDSDKAIVQNLQNTALGTDIVKEVTKVKTARIEELNTANIEWDNAKADLAAFANISYSKDNSNDNIILTNFVQLVDDFDTYRNDYKATEPTKEEFVFSKDAEKLNEGFKRLNLYSNRISRALNAFTNDNTKDVEFKDYTFYQYDIAYIPSEIIAIETLADANVKSSLSWRDFYGISDFVNDRENILGKENLQFYAYSPKIHDAWAELQSKYPEKTKNINYDNLSQEIQSLDTILTQLKSFIDSYEDQKSSDKENTTSIFNLLKKYINNTKLPKDVKLLGFDSEFPIFQNEDEFKDFIDSDATLVKEYLDLILNGVTDSNIEFRKLGINQYLVKIKNDLQADKQDEFAKLLQAISNVVEATDKLDSSNVQSLNDYSKLLSDTRKLADVWKANASISRFVAYEQLLELASFKYDVEKAINIATDLVQNANKYKEDLIAYEVNDLKKKEAEFKWNHLISILDIDSTTINEKLFDLLQTFETQNAVLSNNISEFITKKLEANKLSNKWIIDLLNFSNFDEVLAKRKYSSDLQVSELDTEINQLEQAINSSDEKIKELEPILEVRKKDLISELNTVLEADKATNKTKKQRIIELTDPIINSLSAFNSESVETDASGQTLRFQSWYSAIKESYDKQINELLNANSSALAQLSQNNLSTLQRAQLEDLVKKNSEFIQYWLKSLAQLDFFSNWFRDYETQLKELKQKVEAEEVPATDIQRFLFNFIQVLTGFTNAPTQEVDKTIRRILFNLKNLTDENNKEITLNYRMSVHTAVEAYNDAIYRINNFKDNKTNYATKIAVLKAEKAKLDSYNANASSQAELTRVASELQDGKEKLQQYENDLANIQNILTSKANKTNLIDIKASELLQEINIEVQKDSLIEQAKQSLSEINQSSYVLNVDKAQLKQKEQTSSYSSLYAEIQSLKKEFSKLIQTYPEEYKFGIFLRQIKSTGILGINQDSLDRKRTIDEINSSTVLSDEWKNIITTYISNIEEIKDSATHIFASFENIKNKIHGIIIKLINANVSLQTERSNFANEIVKQFEKKINTVFASVDTNKLASENAKELFKQLEELIKEFNFELVKNDIKDSYINSLEEEFKNLNSYLETVASEQHGYGSLLFAFLESQAWARTDRMQEKYARMFYPLIKHSLENNGVELNLIKQNIQAKINKFSSATVERTKLEKQLELLNNINNYVDSFAKFNNETELFDESKITDAFDVRVFFNATYKNLKKSEKKLDGQLVNVQKYLEKFNAILDTNLGDADIDKRLMPLFEKGVKVATDLIVDVRTNDLINNRKQIMIANNKLGDAIENANDLIVAKSRIELIDILTKKRLLKPGATNEEIDAVIHKVSLSNVSKEGTIIIFTMRETTQGDFAYEITDSATKKGYTSKYIKLNADANASKEVISVVNDLMSTLGYKKMVVPKIIKEQNEIKNPETGAWEKTYDLFAEAYENLTDSLLENVPFAGEWLDGPHIAKRINEDGYIEYKLENGPYLGFSKDSRVGLWAILKMSDPNFKGISTDFLKFVGAHEYGHHMTLNGAHDLSNRGSNPIFVSALTPNATPNINNYYSKDVVELYLKARTHVELDTKRLLDEFDVVQDYGEYATFKFPKLENGQITFEDKETDAVKSLEEDKDIWGVPLDSQDLRKALSNKNRRFLQNYTGMLEAVAARRKQNGLDGENEKWLSPFDLWIINAIDFYSGTLNPTVDSKFKNAKTVKYMIKDENGEYVFTDANINMLEGVLKDGMGNLVKFDSVTTEDGITLEPKVVEGIKDPATGNYVLISKVLMFNADGSPVISAPLNVRLDDKNDKNYDPNAIKYVNDQIQMIDRAIKSLIVIRFTINGWDGGNSRLSADPVIELDYPAIRNLFGNTVPSEVSAFFKNIYKDYVSVRDVNTGLYKVGVPNKIKPYNLNGSVDKSSAFPQDIPMSMIYGNPSVWNTDKSVGFGELMRTLFTSGNSFGNMMNGGNGQVLFISKDKQYIPNTNINEAFADLFFKNSLPATYMTIFQAKKTLKWLSTYTPLFVTNNPASHAVWLMKNNNGSTIAGSNARDFEYASISKVGINYTDRLSRIDNNPLTGLFGLFKGENGELGSKVEFSDYQQWLDFITVDFKQSTFDENSNIVNWNVDYVNSKVDITKFKQVYKTNVIDKINTLDLPNSEKESLISKYSEFEFLANEDTSNQMWANEIMTRFSTSLFAMFTSNLSLKDFENNKNLAWIFDKNVGYGEFKKQEFKMVNPDTKTWEISVDDLNKTYKKIADYLSVDVEQLNLFDALVFDGKIQAYTNQTTVAVQLQKFDLLSVFSSLATGAFKTAPSDDVTSYFKTKNERKYNEFFSDYTYSFAEVINRDNLQITYSPSRNEFGNMPSFLSGISESNTGLEYIVDGTATRKWLSKALKLRDTRGRNGIVNTIVEQEHLFDLEQEYKANAIGIKHKKRTMSVDKNLSETISYSNNYFGDFQSINNGWFKDRWYRDILNFKLYDDKGKDIVDETIRIKDLKGETVKTRAKAYWEYYIQSQGVGRRNISSIWRDSDKDAVSMFGYLTSDVADKANFLAFKDKATGEIKTLRITKENTSNMFYYKSQNIENEEKYDAGDKSVRHTLADEEYDFTDKNGHHKGVGFVAWASDYAIMSKYRNALLLPGHSYEIYFSSDSAGLKDKLLVDLGDWHSLAENGKTFSQAPIKISQYKVDRNKAYEYILDENNEKIYEPTIFINDQFNGVK
ncbi:PDxFFG protein [Mycoplasmopsis felifaucium]|uniref:PDxFFG protein n=1 Tax=Mycoplasmopsis felifaucium TaxID=35768 RepID=UPI0004820915|nr:PDxFFG protein [Mycoplasmopsis felifaucium]